MLGRRAERDAVDHLLVGAQAGSSGVLVVCGDAGIGKTSLLEHVRDSATPSGFRVEASLGVESEAPFPFAGVHQMCAPMSDSVGGLPEPPQHDLGVALGLPAGDAPHG